MEQSLIPMDENRSKTTPKFAKTLGEELKKERELRGVSLEQIASATRINLRYLYLIEADRYEDLPAKPFVMGFLRAYLRVLDIEADSYLRDRLDLFENLLKKRNAPAEAFEDSSEDGRSFRARAVLWIAMGVFLAIGGVLLVVLKPTLSHKKITPIEKLKDAAQNDIENSTAAPTLPPAGKNDDGQVLVEQVVSKEVLNPSGSQNPKETEPAVNLEVKPDPLFKGDNLSNDQVKAKIVVKALEDVWVRYKAGDRQVQQFLLRKDKLLVIKDENAVYVQVSNPKAILYKTLKTAFAPTAQNELKDAMSASSSVQDVFSGYRPLPSSADPVLEKPSE